MFLVTDSSIIFMDLGSRNDDILSKLGFVFLINSLGIAFVSVVFGIVVEVIIIT